MPVKVATGKAKATKEPIVEEILNEKIKELLSMYLKEFEIFLDGH